MIKSVELKDSGSSLTLNTYDVLEILLPENGTTGYLWHLDVSIDRSMEVVKDEFKAKSDALGAGGVRKIHWAFSKPGNFPIRYVLKQAWNPAEEGKFEIQVEVKAS